MLETVYIWVLADQGLNRSGRLAENYSHCFVKFDIKHLQILIFKHLCSHMMF